MPVTQNGTGLLVGVDRARTVHISRTMMFAEVSTLFDVVHSNASLANYRSAVVDDNVLLKRTMSNREKTFRFLRELYALDTSDLLFVAFRKFWDADPAGRRALALLNAAFRDEVLRPSLNAILASTPSTPVTKVQLGEVIAAAYPHRFGEKSLAKISRNVASTWTQSGHLEGHADKHRSAVQATIGSATFALLFGWLDGQRGLGLFETPWARLVTTSAAELDTLAFAASNRDWLRYKRMGDVVEIDFLEFIGTLEEARG